MEWKFINWITGEILEGNNLNDLKEDIEHKWNNDDLIKIFKGNNETPYFVGSKKAFFRTH